MSGYLTIEEARTQLLGVVSQINQHHTQSLLEARGRTLAENIHAPYDLPPYSRAAMDGFAFRAEDTPGILPVTGRIYAGEYWEAPLNPGESLRVMTGAPIPLGANTVLEQEQVTLRQGAIHIPEAVRSNRNIMKRGHEYRADDLILTAGTRLTAIAIGQLASVGITQVKVVDRPRILVATTGNEVVPGGQALSYGHIHDTNGPLLEALLSDQGAIVERTAVIDNPESIRSFLNACQKASYDLILTTGGVSVGEHDYLPDILLRDFHRLFWRVDMHPGKAMAAGQIGTTPLIALSGNPGAVLTAWYLIVAPIIAHLTGAPHHFRRVKGRLKARYPKSTRETRVLKAQFLLEDMGLLFDVIDNQSSDALCSFQKADGLVMIPHQSPPQESGTILEGFWLP